ncbi:MAG TPA: DUF5994 family protein [Pilimelia sp.]|nr:DUF5994 family protein [Pilimelia sp.]
MTITAAQRATIVPPSPPSTPRVRLVSARAGQAVLDGGWWPRSSDPIAELPGLVLTLGDRYGPIRHVILNSNAWDSRFRRLAVGGRAVRMGWFTSLDPALATATDRGDQLDLLVVPPRTAEAAARDAMARAADPANTMRAPDILAAIPAASAQVPVAAAGQDADADSVWDDEGGHLVDNRPHRALKRHPADSPG